MIKYCITVLLCLAVSLQKTSFGNSIPITQNANLVVNGGFESGLSNWDSWNNPQIIDSDEVEGNSALMMIEKGSISQTISVMPLTTYVVSGWARISHENARLVFAAEGFGESNVTNSTYTRHTIQFTTGENTSSVKIFFWLPPNAEVGSSLTAFVDDVQMIELDEATQFNVTGRTPVNTTQIDVSDSISLIFNKEVNVETGHGIDVYINKEPANNNYTWSVSSFNTLSLHPGGSWAPGSLISLKVNTSATSAGGLAFNGTTSEFKYIVDTENNFGFERIDIPTLVTRNNGTHNIPLKVALPLDRSNPVPIQFWVHGGGWSGGTASDSWAYHGPHSEYLAEKMGIATLEIAYRCMGSNGTFAQAMEDIDAAYQWAVEHAEEYNLDIDNSFFSGGSAGTPLSSLAAQIYPNIKGYVGFNGIYNFADNPGSAWPAPNIYEYCTPLCETNSAIFNIRDNPPVTLLLHGDQDGTINHTQSTLFADAIVDGGGEALAIIYEGEAHAFFNPGRVQYEDCLFEMTRFLSGHGIVQNAQTNTGKVRHKRIELMVWPNPASESISISTQQLKGKTILTIINITGQEVLKDEFDALQSMKVTVPLAVLPQGWYILKLRDEAGAVFSHRMVVK